MKWNPNRCRSPRSPGDPLPPSPFRLVLSLLAVLLSVATVPAPAQVNIDDTTLLYRGELTSGGVPAEGRFDLRFHLYSGAEPDPSQPLETHEAFGVKVTGGRFEVELELDHRPEDAQLGIEVAAANSGAFVPLLPLQPLGSAFESLPATSSSLDSKGLTYEVSTLTGGNLHVGGKLVAGGVELDGRVVTSWDELGDGGAMEIAYRSSTTSDGKLPEMTVQSGGGWITGGSKSITVDDPGTLWVMLTGTAYQPFPSGDYHASVSIGIGNRAGTSPPNQFTSINLGGGQNASAGFVTQYVRQVPSAGTYTFYVIARWNHGWSPTAIRPEGMTLLFVPD